MDRRPAGGPGSHVRGAETQEQAERCVGSRKRGTCGPQALVRRGCFSASGPLPAGRTPFSSLRTSPFGGAGAVLLATRRPGRCRRRRGPELPAARAAHHTVALDTAAHAGRSSVTETPRTLRAPRGHAAGGHVCTHRHPRPPPAFRAGPPSQHALRPSSRWATRANLGRK